MSKAKAIKDRLKYVVNGDCWEFAGRKTPEGYGVFTVRGKNCFTHRASYQEYVGPIPNGLLVCHKCDNPPCIRPDHLFVGTNSDNLQDAISKGRWSPYSKKKLTLQLVADIEKCLKDGMPPIATAAKFGVHNSTVYRIRSGHMWRPSVRATAAKYLGKSRREVRNEKRG